MTLIQAPNFTYTSEIPGVLVEISGHGPDLYQTKYYQHKSDKKKKGTESQTDSSLRSKS